MVFPVELDGVPKDDLELTRVSGDDPEVSGSAQSCKSVSHFCKSLKKQVLVVPYLYKLD